MTQHELLPAGVPPVDMNLVPGADPASLGQLFEALAAAQGEFPPIAKNRTANIRSKDASKASYTFDYADLQEIRDKTTPSLAKQSLALMQLVTDRPAGGTHIRTILAHKSGARVETTMNVPRGDGEIKNFGATITYLRRYIITGLLNIAADADLDDDDDPAAGSGQSPVATEAHPDMRAAKTIGELSKIMSGLSKEDKQRYGDYFNQRSAELREAA